MSHLTQTPLSELTLNEPARPKMPPLAEASDADRRAGRHLAAIHRHYLLEMSKIAKILDRIAAGDAPPAELEQIVLHSEMTKNFAVAGTLCGHQCQVLQMHHDIEEHHMFPGLAAQPNAALTRVVDKLKSEHLVIHELLDRLRSAAATLSEAQDEASFAAAHEVFSVLRGAVLSHFGYEEAELEEAIGLYLDGA